MDTFTLDIVTPEAKFFSEPASLVEIPGTEGDFGVLPGHMAFVSTIRPGVITIHAPAHAVQRVFVSGGVAEVNNTSCTILAERLIDLASLNRAEAEARLAAARQVLDNAFDESARIDAAREMELAEAVVLAVAA